MKKDKSIKKEATNLWIEANSAKKRMEELIGLDVRLDADGKETWELFREINSEREKARLRFFNNKDSLLLIQATAQLSTTPCSFSRQ